MATVSSHSAISWDFAQREFLLHLEAHRARKTVIFYRTQIGQLASWAEREEIPIQRRLLVAETTLVGLITLVTGLVDRTEVVDGTAIAAGARHITIYGPLFPLYAAHVLALVTAAVGTALLARRNLPRPVQGQLGLIGAGILATGSIAVVTNAVLPYLFGDFRFIDIGPFSTVLFLLAVAYAVVRHHLFDVRVFVRRTLAYGLLLSLALAAYTSLTVLVTERFAGTGSDAALTRFGVLLIASSFDPLRRLLEHRVDRLLFDHGGRDRDRRGRKIAVRHD